MKYLSAPGEGKILRAILTVGAVLLILSSCAVADITNLAGGGGTVTPPKWDLDFELPLISRTEAMGDYFTVPNIAPITINDINWTALRSDLSPADLLALGALSTGALEIDFDKNGTSDFEVEQLVSINGDGYIELKVISTGSPLSVGDITVGTCNIDGTIYTFDGGTADGANAVVFRTTNFLSSPGAGHQLDPLNAETPNKFDFNSFTLNIINGSDNAGKTGTVSFQFTVNLGENYDIVGTTAGTPTKLYSITDQSVPLSSNQMLIKSFYINLETTNNIPIVFNVNAKFSANGTDYNITENGSNNIDIEQGESNSELDTDSTVFSKPDIKVSFDLYIPANATVTISNSMDIGVKMLVGGKGVINLNSL